jgi:hypothetical protein
VSIDVGVWYFSYNGAVVTMDYRFASSEVAYVVEGHGPYYYVDPSKLNLSRLQPVPLECSDLFVATVQS